ncbi:hypothetical protein [Streptomyces sp. NPDC047070]|uniref:hypothetical protein n=1 Tax=Streptomyces sp. NPDC047070 TaxID=3154923 RepID=UPI0034545BA4
MNAASLTIPPYPTDEDHVPLPCDVSLAEIVRADEVREGDLVIGSAEAQLGVAFHNDHYRATPTTYDRECGCGVCYLSANEEGPVVNLSDDNHWGACDSMPANWLVVVIRAAHLA